MPEQNFTLPYPPLQVRAGVLVADGYGISLRVLYGKLRVEDGIGTHRRSIALDRAGSGLERLVLLGKSGTLTLESLAWLRAIGAALVHLSADGHVLTHSVPFGYDGHPIRRAQALAIATGLDVDLARDLIAQQARRPAREPRAATRSRISPRFDAPARIAGSRCYDRRSTVVRGEGRGDLLERLVERSPIRLRGRDLARIPAHWARYDSRASVLTGAPRAATNPVNALLNYRLFPSRIGIAPRTSRGRSRSDAWRAPRRPAESGLLCARRDGAGSPGCGRLCSRSLGGPHVYLARFRGTSERRLSPPRSADARPRAHASRVETARRHRPLRTSRRLSGTRYSFETRRVESRVP